MKQGPEKTQFVKDPEEDTNKYIFQKNRKTKIGALILIVFLVSLLIGLLVSNSFLST